MASKYNVWIRVEAVYTDGSIEEVYSELATQEDTQDKAEEIAKELVAHAETY